MKLNQNIIIKRLKHLNDVDRKNKMNKIIKQYKKINKNKN